MKSAVVWSKQSDHWATPVELYKKLDGEFHFNFDPCPLNSEFDGLLIDWGERCFVNPPYSNIKGFLKKALEELEKSTEIVVFLIPSRTDTKWFHEYLYNKAELRFIKGRLKFGGSKNNAPFPSMVAVLKR